MTVVAMAEALGLVQRMTVLSGLACVWVGPTPNNAELLLITNDGSAQDIAFASGLIQTLASAATNYRSVAAVHGANQSKITAVRIDPV
jgi:hypothetical protein